MSAAVAGPTSIRPAPSYTTLRDVTMARSPTLTMASYDRLFPSRDTLPKGGFGNLIALPLQGDARRLGNTLFLDEGLDPYDDQWAFLDSLPRIEANQLERTVRRGERDGSILDARGEGTGGEQAPWRARGPLPSRLASAATPEKVSATLAQRL